MSKFDEEVMWATSGTGDDFQCVHVDFAREQEAEIQKLRDAMENILKMADGAHASSWMTAPDVWTRISDIRIAAQTVLSHPSS